MWGPDDIYTLQAASVGVIQFSSKGGICFAPLRTRCGAAVAAGVWILLGGPQVDKESLIRIPSVRCEGTMDLMCSEGRSEKASLVIPGPSIPGMPSPTGFHPTLS